ncbi:MAG: aminotransferase class V-fold PLP-dependent enzyme [Pirellulales bacterium]|nr:aminotransferase class V-fold PLP-dependent enzyme [Pirellulales bacterium]
MARIYLDNAATSWPKPPAVYEAVEHALRTVGAAAGRAAYREAIEADALVADARRQIATLLGIAQPHQVVFTFNGTDSLNLALHGLLARGGRVVTTAAEHNSVLRPLRRLEEQGQISVARVPVSNAGVVDPDDVRRALADGARLLAVTHASNVTGAIQPVAELARLAHQCGALVLVDAAQTAGELPLDVTALDCDLLAAPGHKGLLGPLGTGVLYVRPELERELESFRQGGTGSESWQDRQPETLPDKFESGNLNVPGLAGLGAAAGWLLRRGVASIVEHARRLSQRLYEGLAGIDGIRLFGPSDPAARVGIVSIALDQLDPQTAAAALDTAFGIQTRAGLHCAPLMHAALGTLHAGGTLRFSVGPFNTDEDIALTLAAMEQLAGKMLKVGT